MTRTIRQERLAKRSAAQAARRRGMTLVELMVYVALLAIVAAFTLRAIGDSRMLRSGARDRSVMALIAQSELERIRQLPATQLVEGRTARTDPAWPSGVSATVELKPSGEEGAWLIDVWVQRQSPEGKPTVRLTSIRQCKM